MSNSIFLSTNTPQTTNNLNPYNMISPYNYNIMDGYDHHCDQDYQVLSDHYLPLLDHPKEDNFSSSCFTVLQERSNLPRNSHLKCKSGVKRVKKDVRGKIAFRTKSDLEVMDDGYKWRKYGKKMVKNNPNPRNYYKCTTEGCNVKKRVERDPDDSSFVITTYEGMHNHQSPGLIYCNEMPLSLPGGRTLQPSEYSSS